MVLLFAMLGVLSIYHRLSDSSDLSDDEKLKLKKKYNLTTFQKFEKKKNQFCYKPKTRFFVVFKTYSALIMSLDVLVS